MKQVEEKHLVLCADDFGMSQAVNEGILALGRQGRLNATSCLVYGPHFSSGAPALRALRLQCGLHLNFTEAMGHNGLYLPVSSLIVDTLLRRLDPAQLRRQIGDQLDRYEDAFGAAPAFIDGHQHVHQFSQIRTALFAELDKRYASEDGRPWLRNTLPGSLAAIPARQRLKAYVVGALGARRLNGLARTAGYVVNRSFLGVYDFRGGDRAYARLLRVWLQNARHGDVIMCHPASQGGTGDGMTLQRHAEYQVLASKEMADWLRQYRIRLPQVRE